MAKFSDVFSETVERPAGSKPKIQKVQMIHYSKLIPSVYQYRTRTREQILATANLIKAEGEITEPCIVRKSGPGSDNYEVIAGHKRTLATKYLVEEEHLEEFAFVPCIVKNYSDVRAEFATYSSNNHDEKTPYEILCEIEGMARLLEEHPEEFPEFSGKGRLVEKLAAQMNMSRSVVSDYQNISHNLGEKGKEALKSGTIDKSAAVTLASMSEERQEEALEQGLTKRSQIRQWEKEQKNELQEEDPENKPVLPGWMTITKFYYTYAQESVHHAAVDQWADILREKYGRGHAGAYGREVKFHCSLRGIAFEGYEEITWAKLISLFKLYLPVKELEAENKLAMSETEEEPLPGQMNVSDYPELLPENENTDTGTTGYTVEYATEKKVEERSEEEEAAYRKDLDNACKRLIQFFENNDWDGMIEETDTIRMLAVNMRKL